MSQIMQEVTPIEAVNNTLVQQLFEMHGEVCYVFNNKDRLILEKEKSNYVFVGDVEYFYVAFGSYENYGEDAWMICQPQYFPLTDIDRAVNAFVTRLKSDQVYQTTGDSTDLKDIRILNTRKLEFESHYDYIDAVWEDFRMEIFGKSASDAWRSGMGGAHGDKCYGSKTEWAAAGISFAHGALLYLLTYTPEFGNTEKWRSEQWVIENYPKYYPIIQAVEKKVLKERYNID